MNLKKKFLLKLLFINTFIFSTIILSLEIFSRAFFPEFKGDLFSENVTRSINYHKGYLNGVRLVRIPYPGFRVNTNKGLFIVLGDSITQGFGLPYDDIYWVKIKNLNNLIRRKKLEFIPIGGYGRDLSVLSNADDIKKVANAFKSSDKYIMYQFNFNDINPPKNHEIVGEKKNSFEKINSYINESIYRDINKSVAFRVFKHYAGILKRKSLKNKNCEKKGSLSLQAYTYTYGSKGFEKDSQMAWTEFEKNLISLKKIASDINAKFYMFISPIIFDIDNDNIHPYFNTYGLDFSCATIDPRKKLFEIANKHNILLIDPKEYLRNKFILNLKEGNFKSFYFPTDENHINAEASEHIANYLFSEIFIKNYGFKQY